MSIAACPGKAAENLISDSGMLLEIENTREIPRFFYGRDHDMLSIPGCRRVFSGRMMASSAVMVLLAACAPVQESAWQGPGMVSGKVSAMGPSGPIGP